MPGHPDFQAYALWIGAPLVQQTGLAIGSGSHTDSAINVSNFASVILAVKPTGGTIVATLTQSVVGGPASLAFATQYTIASGSVAFNTLVLTGNLVTLQLQGNTGGETVDYALYPSNTTVSTPSVTGATLKFQHNAGATITEPGVDVEDSPFAAWTLTDDPGSSRVKLSAVPPTVLGYSEFTSPVTVTGTSEGATTSVVSVTTVALDGVTPVLVDFYAPHVQWTPNAGGDAGTLVLFDGAGVVGHMAVMQAAGTGQQGAPVTLRAHLNGNTFAIPSAGAHTYKVGGWKTVAGDTFRVDAGAGGAGNYLPGFVHVRAES